MPSRIALRGEGWEAEGFENVFLCLCAPSNLRPDYAVGVGDSTNPAKTLPYLALHSRMKELANIRYWRLPSQLVVSVHCVPRITKAKAAKIVMFCFLELDVFPS